MLEFLVQTLKINVLKIGLNQELNLKKFFQSNDNWLKILIFMYLIT